VPPPKKFSCGNVLGFGLSGVRHTKAINSIKPNGMFTEIRAKLDPKMPNAEALHAETRADVLAGEAHRWLSLAATAIQRRKERVELFS
jgi:hypothetical protein